MNLWAKSLGRLVLFASALFFFSCEDESSFLGFKNPNEKFNVARIDLDVPSSVLSIDSVVTDYSGTLSNSVPFHAVGEIIDPVMGRLRAETYLQYRPTETVKLA